MNDQDLDAWHDGLDESTRDYVDTASTVQICVRFTERAAAECREAEAALSAARTHAETVITNAMARVEASRAFLERTIVTAEQAIQLHTMGRR